MRKKDKEIDKMASVHYKERRSLNKTITTLQGIATSSSVQVSRNDFELASKLDTAVKKAKKDALDRHAKERKADADSVRRALLEKKVSETWAALNICLTLFLCST